jgi:hypothetical protein
MISSIDDQIDETINKQLMTPCGLGRSLDISCDWWGVYTIGAST